MNRRLIWISGALNLALAAGVFLRMNSEPPILRGIPAIAEPAAGPRAVPANAEIPSPKISPEPGSSFRWSHVFSSDLKVYRDNLRAVGCPALTVHDILLAEINERFELRRQSILASVQSRFWELAVRGEAAIRNEWGPPIEALSGERQSMIEEVLGGKDYGFAEAESAASREDFQRDLSWLPAEKRARMSALEQTRQQRLEDWAKSAGRRTGGPLTAEDQAQLLEVQKEFDDARNELLTADEWEESRLRSSRESLWAAGLSGFEPTPEEWRAVTRLRADFEDGQRSLDSPDLSPEDRLRKQEEWQAELTRATRDALGAERFSQYEIANDGQFQEVQAVTQRYGLPDEIALQAYEVEQSALARAQRVREDPTVSTEMREAALAAIQQETERILARTLGGKVLATYQEYSGSWLKELGTQ